MTDIAIRVENLSKLYRIGGKQESYRTLRDTLTDAFVSPFRRAGRLLKGQATGASELNESIWALKDVSFEIKQGEVIGIIGRNGAGKSTLLKILSRITEPTEGYADVYGRVGSLLEVGTGFHTELTGRENIYLNGAILGMKKAEIDRKFDEIVSFAEVEKFIDTPVKHYSTGMYLRLAFAVAAHLEPEILLVDEVLAVGDAAFQKKCLGKMGEVAKEGRTVLFVSHNMGAVNQLCRMSILLEDGRIRCLGETPEIITLYLRSSTTSSETGETRFQEDAQKEAQLRQVRLLDEKGFVTQKFNCDESIIIQLLFQVHKRVPGLYGYLRVSKMDGTWVMVSDSFDTGPNQLDNLLPGMYKISIPVPARSLALGEYNVYLNFASISGTNFNVDSPGVVCSFSLDDFTSKRGNRRDGFFSTLLPWTVSNISAREKE